MAASRERSIIPNVSANLLELCFWKNINKWACNLGMGGKKHNHKWECFKCLGLLNKFVMLALWYPRPQISKYRLKFNSESYILGWKNVVIWISKAFEMRPLYSEIFNSHQTVDRVASFLRDTWWEERWLESPASSSPLSPATSSQMGGKQSPPRAQPMAVT